ncbi:MAG: tyrosine-type recombinase/integrase [Halothiobacillaceae bacterium]
MFQKLFSDEAALRRHCEAPFADERERYLQHCADLGGTRATLLVKSTELLWLASHLDASAARGVDLETLQSIVRKRQAICRGKSSGRRLIDIARPWFRFLGWWHEPDFQIRSHHQLERYLSWMRDERGFSPMTVERWGAHARMLLQWSEKTGCDLSALQPGDIDRYFINEGTGRWSRVSVANIAAALRSFLRFTATQGGCDSRLAETIQRPRIYEHESLPYAPDWSDVQRMLAACATDKPKDIRDRAILMLLAIYGLRRSEVASLRLDQIDWSGRVIRISRAKRRQEQIYPLLPSVAEALACYIDVVRPQIPFAEVFIRQLAPRRPITAAAIYDVVNRRFIALSIQVAHRGPHALRHACAARLVAERLTLKEIGDHLGHRSQASTRIYAKVDLVSLREVGEFDLGALP